MPEEKTEEEVVRPPILPPNPPRRRSDQRRKTIAATRALKGRYRAAKRAGEKRGMRAWARKVDGEGAGWLQRKAVSARCGKKKG
jgi:hypothetical protein